jgi:hypothetical protein
VRYLRLSVGLVLGGEIFILGKNLLARQKEFIARMFFKWAFFLKVKKARPAHVGKSNYFAKRGGTGKVKKGGFNKIPPPFLF